MSRKHGKQRVQQSKKSVLVIDGIAVTRAHMPKYNAFQGGYGAHGVPKYNRAKNKRQFERELNDI